VQYRPEHPTTALALNNLGDAFLSLGRLDEAKPFFEKALVI
jgi:tetratricopeptide (TPR) repeat protein